MNGPREFQNFSWVLGQRPSSKIPTRFPGDAAAANGFGRRSLQECVALLLFEANIAAPSDMRVEPTGW